MTLGRTALCAEYNIAPDIELIEIQEINKAYKKAIIYFANTAAPVGVST